MPPGGPVEAKRATADLVRKQRPQDALSAHQLHSEAAEDSATAVDERPGRSLPVSEYAKQIGAELSIFRLLLGAEFHLAEMAGVKWDGQHRVYGLSLVSIRGT